MPFCVCVCVEREGGSGKYGHLDGELPPSPIDEILATKPMKEKVKAPIVTYNIMCKHHTPDNTHCGVCVHCTHVLHIMHATCQCIHIQWQSILPHP